MDDPFDNGGSIASGEEWIIAEAMATALIALEQLPLTQQPKRNMDDLRRLLAERFSPTNISLHLAQATIRLRPDLDPTLVFAGYGFPPPEPCHPNNDGK